MVLEKIFLRTLERQLISYTRWLSFRYRVL